MKWLMLALGGSLGCFARFYIGELSAQVSTSSFPYATLAVNIIGAFIAGVVMVLVWEKAALNEHWRLLLLVGFAGSLTTFSAFSLETFYLIEAQAYLRALTNVLLNVVLSLGFIFLGVGATRYFLNS